ncbi:MAG TPA: hypothetical protein VIL46_06830 [Gemmataceae bacterium]
MHPFERPPKSPPPGVRPSLQVRLKEGWRLAPGKRSLLTPEGEETPLKGVLPPRARVVPLTPGLAGAEPAALSAEERYLARQVQVIFPRGTDPARYADALRRLEGVEEVRPAPQPGLP